MKERVRIKSFSKGLILQLDEKASFDELLSEVASKFSEGKHFFGKETVAISFAGRKLTDEEQIQILDCIQFNCYLKILCIVEKDEAREKLFMKTLRQAKIRELAETDLSQEIQVFHGSLKDGEELDTPNSIVIFGDVEPGCSVFSEKSILVLGSLYGSARAAVDGDAKSAIIAALEMAPQALAIGDFKYDPPGKKNKWGRKKKEEAQVARIQGDTIVMEELTKEHLKAF